MTNEPHLVKPRAFDRATRLELTTGEIAPGDKRELLVAEVQALVDKVNALLEMRDGITKRIPRRPKGMREAEFDRLSEEYAKLMMEIENKHAELNELEKSLKIYDESGK